MKSILTILSICIYGIVSAQELTLVNNIEGRKKMSLNGQWQILIDPYENGFYDYRLKESANGFFKNQKPQNNQDLVEYDFVSTDYLNVPGDWNSQREKLQLYEGTIWYQRNFDYNAADNGRQFLYFGACNYYSIVYLNGKKLGEHEGGFSPFCFEITGMLNKHDNSVVVKVDNKRRADGVPTVNTDWWNYGGITRDVYLAETKANFIQDYSIKLNKGDFNTIHAAVTLNKAVKQQAIQVLIPELNIKKSITVKNGTDAIFSLSARPKLWAPSHPKLYDVQFVIGNDTLKDRIGFRTIETRGQEILLNGKPIFLKGICVHEEVPQRGARANGYDDARLLLGWAKELGCNYVRLAHYPHNEAMLKLADQLGLMVWAEIPVYWTIHYEDKQVLEKAKQQLAASIRQNKNRAAVVIWSMANETPVSEDRNKFLASLCEYTRSLDSSRLLSAALEINFSVKGTYSIDDPLGKYLDVLGCNEYLGWYFGKSDDFQTTKWSTPYQKPLVISEFGGEALYGRHGRQEDLWTEEYQEQLYKNQISMLSKIPFLRGMTPWILADFRSPRRQLHGVQDMWNRKGLISDKGLKKKAWYILHDYYSTIPMN